MSVKNKKTHAQDKFLQKLGSRTPAIGSDHPFSQGMKLVLITDSRHGRGAIRLSTAKMKRYMDLIGHGQSDGLHAAWVESQITIIAIKPTEDTLVRVVELVVHEVSHYLDALFEQCRVKLVDTELRSYYLDWMVGKCMHQFKL